jgi:hypothetical protein
VSTDRWKGVLGSGVSRMGQDTTIILDGIPNKLRVLPHPVKRANCSAFDHHTYPI